MLRAEREQALATLRQHGITMERGAEGEEEEEGEMSSAAVQHIEELQQQNNNLRQV